MALMARLDAVTEDDLDDAQRAVWAQVTGGARAAAHGDTGGLVDERGGLIGPFNAWMYAPVPGVAAAQLGEALRFSSSLADNLRELITVTVAAHWRCNFEMWAHRGFAIDAGVDQAAIDALQRGERPDLADPVEALVVDAGRELLTAGRLGEERYADAVGHLGERGVVEMVTLVGYYSLVALNLNAFEVSLPPGVEPVWPD